MESLPRLIERARRIRLMLFDVDGVLTDGTLYVGEGGEIMKAFNARDGHGMKMLAESGIEVGLISSRQSRIVAMRAAELGIALVRQGAADKAVEFAAILAERKIDAAQAGFMGDDVLDLPVLTRCGFAASVPEAPEAVRSRAHFVPGSAGGRGAAREVCEFILRAQNNFDAALNRYLR
ncbi:MAG: phenylphosphate carboxylase subunit delta [Betaproteobacteria bacterium RIFCSPLOWO2_02_FULL_62_17]|nr:MAG: phenylphosphate carboxylase subunit delta [Betaproteobacteria bacterium RIFCSPLOWO2_02_FULL_62_17]